NMATFNTKDLKKVRNLAIIVSTQGVGEPPIEAGEFHDLLQHGKVPSIQHIKYAVLSLGDTSYSQFCQTGKDFDHFLERLRASRLLTRKDCDVDYEDDALSWMEALITRIKSSSSPVYSIVEQSP